MPNTSNILLDMKKNGESNTDINKVNGSLNQNQYKSLTERDIRGCMDISALNYNASATIDDGSCTYLKDEGENEKAVVKNWDYYLAATNYEAQEKPTSKFDISLHVFGNTDKPGSPGMTKVEGQDSKQITEYLLNQRLNGLDLKVRVQENAIYDPLSGDLIKPQGIYVSSNEVATKEDLVSYFFSDWFKENKPELFEKLKYLNKTIF